MKNVTESKLETAREVLREFIEHFKEKGYSLPVIQMFEAVESSLILDKNGIILRPPYVPRVAAKAKPILSYNPLEKHFIPSQGYLGGIGNAGDPICYPSSGQSGAISSIIPSMYRSIFDGPGK